MQRYEVWAVWIGAAALVSPLLSLVVTTQMLGERFPSAWWGGVVAALVQYLANVIVAVWLFVEARRRGASPWVWSMLGLLFSLVAAVLFFVLRAFEARSGRSEPGSHAV
jgi:hypothetical protein